MLSIDDVNAGTVGNRESNKHAKEESTMVRIEDLVRQQGAGDMPRLGSVPPMLKADESIRKKVRLASGLLDPVQAADALGVDELHVHRLAARGRLTANQAGDVPVFRQSDVDAYVGRRLPDLKPGGKIGRSGWFVGDDHPVSEQMFRQRIGSHADEVRPVSESELDAAYRRDPSASQYRFSRPASDGMQTEYARYGLSFVVSTMRSHARFVVGQTNSTSAHVMHTPAWILYSSPEYYAAVIASAAAKMEGYVFTLNVPSPPPISNKSIRIEIRLDSVAGVSMLGDDIVHASNIGF